MNNMAKQMEMFDDGGLMDEGGTVDPVSGNDVPPGSNQEEVRDDIPAQLSEGEFVFPADVVRYFGLEKLMEMRQKAKMGLQRMEDMGQMGNSEEAIMPDNLPFDIDDIDMEDDGLEMNIGGFISSPVSVAAGNALGQAVGQVGTVQTPNQSQSLRTLAPVFPAVVVYGPDGTSYPSPQAAIAAGVNNYTMTPPSRQPSQPTPPTTGQAAAPIEAASAKFQQLGGTKFTPTTSTPQQAMPTFKETIGMGVPYVDYDPNAPVETEQPETPAEVAPPATGQPSDDSGNDGGDSRDYGGGTSLTTGEKIAGYSPEEIESGVASAKDRYAVTGNRGIELLNFLPGGQLLKSLLGTDDEPSKGLFSNTPEAMPTGLTDSDGNMIPSASADYMKNLGGLPSTDTMTETTRTSGSPLPNMNVLPASAKTVRNLQNLRGILGVTPTRYVGFEKGDLDPNSGGFFNKDGIAIDPETGGAAKNENGTMNYASFQDFKNAIAAGNESGWRGGVISSTDYKGLSTKGKANYDKYADLTNNRKGGAVSAKKAAEEAKAKADKARADKAKADKAKADKAKADKAAAAKAQAEAIAAAERAGYRSKARSYAPDDRGNDNDGPSGGDDSSNESGSGGGMGGGFGSESDGYGGGDYKGAFVGEAYKKNKLAKQMKRSGLASKK